MPRSAQTRAETLAQKGVAAGGQVETDQPLVSVETAKAIVEIPSPQGGRVERLYGERGDIVQTGDPPVEFAGGAEARKDRGTVVGEVQTGDEVLSEAPAAIGGSAAGVKATPAICVRASIPSKRPSALAVFRPKTCAATPLRFRASTPSRVVQHSGVVYGGHGLLS